MLNLFQDNGNNSTNLPPSCGHHDRVGVEVTMEIPQTGWSYCYLLNDIVSRRKSGCRKAWFSGMHCQIEVAPARCSAEKIN
ncbi:hypothetical protein Taro_007190 [Colocasia esculenta]|uniref:Uncharacterized protein n=1 Tax=Colocasia esculenta TaxID=4460 RepID=A0A843TXH3_COLES|nr:hypothetical protein [Colocasia esculenta]